jgi:hypothetical protein
MIASGSSLRGLSEVTIATSASSLAIRPISGRLPRSLSPPQPKTQMTRLPRELTRGPEHVLQRVRLVGVIDDDRERLARLDRLEPAWNALERLDPRRDRVVLDAEQPRDGDGGEHVLDVETAAQLRPQLDPSGPQPRASCRRARAARAGCRHRPQCRR